MIAKVVFSLFLFHITSVVFHYYQISDKEKEDISSDLRAASPRSSSVTDYYKVPFTEALDLVKSRKVYVQRGFAYVPDNELVVIILSIFRSKLSRALAVSILQMCKIFACTGIKLLWIACELFCNFSFLFESITKLLFAKVTCRSLPQLEEDDRLLPMLSGLSRRYLGQDYTNKKPLSGNITADMIDGVCLPNVH